MNSSVPIQIPALRSISSAKALRLILLLSAAVIGFLFWLIYFKRPSGHTDGLIARLPALNAFLNGLSSVFLVAGLIAIKRRNYNRHLRFMFAALGSSAVFFVSYVVYYHFHGDTKFTGVGLIRPVYFFILISHITLSAIVVPLILLSFYLSLSGKLTAHRRVSRYTFPIWLYVSVTGVLIFAMLKAFAA